MKCNTCRYELSQCLDGRLPSGRRAVVMQHAASCPACAGFWDELQAAQRLTLQLPRERVSEPFRDQLWERIRAGEGTHEAIFREPLPLLAKARYALTGAAAAAAALLFGLWLHEDRSARSPETTHIVGVESGIEQPRRIEDRTAPTPTPVSYPDSYRDPASGSMAMMSSAQPLTARLFAEETARQIEACFDSVDLSLRQLARRNDPGIVDRIVTESNDLHAFVDVMLELRDRDRLGLILSPEVDSDLRLVSRMLGKVPSQSHSIETVHTWIEPAVKDSRHLRDIRNHISITLSLDSREEATFLINMATTRAEVFPKLFIVMGQSDEICEELGLFRQNFLFESPCGSNYVTPRSRVEPRIR
ncbi:MAG: zf-HC2 domain-containing protein [Planctomycetes bacterium]|nr:zf-HC2 domain-containing protein [Planctomycetota bacterium]